jgi:hypothetical protein
MLQYKAREREERGRKIKIPMSVIECSLQIKVIKMGDNAVRTVLRLLEEWFLEFKDAEPKQALRAIPLPKDWPCDLKASLAEARKPQPGDMSDDADFRASSVIDNTVYTLVKSRPKYALFKTLKQVWDGELDGALKAELNDAGERLHSADKSTLEQLPKVLWSHTIRPLWPLLCFRLCCFSFDGNCSSLNFSTFVLRICAALPVVHDCDQGCS